MDHTIHIYGHLLVITGYYNGIIHSIHGSHNPQLWPFISYNWLLQWDYTFYKWITQSTVMAIY